MRFSFLEPAAATLSDKTPLEKVGIRSPLRSLKDAFGESTLLGFIRGVWPSGSLRFAFCERVGEVGFELWRELDG